MNQYRLTDEELSAIYAANLPTEADYPELLEWRRRLDTIIADTASAKALRQVLAWLRGFEAAHVNSPVDFIAIGRGHGIRMATDELAKLLEEHTNP